MCKSDNNKIDKPRVGLVGLAYPGYNLGEDMCGMKLEEMRHILLKKPVELITPENLVLDITEARKAGAELHNANIDCICAVITTFIPDHFIVELLHQCDVPVFLWAVDRETDCLSLVCCPLITSTLFELNKNYQLTYSDIGNEEALETFLAFCRAAYLRRVLKTMRVGYAGSKNAVMFSMTADDYTLKKVWGVTVETIPMEEFYDIADSIPEKDATDYWEKIKQSVSQCNVSDADGLLSSRNYLAALRLVENHNFDALSINCFPHLKAKICLAVSCLNNTGISAGCEGDLYSTVLMHLLRSLTGQSAFNGDFMEMYPESNEVMFSHCGAGAFCLAESPDYIRLQPSIETNNGLAIIYPTKPFKNITLLNMQGAHDTLRVAAMYGAGIKIELQYKGNPLYIRFETPVNDILDRIAMNGAGHHWNGAPGNFMREFMTLCDWTGVTFNPVTD